MSVDDARCPDCGAIPEMVHGAWWPHAPGASCRDAINRQKFDAGLGASIRKETFDFDAKAFERHGRKPSRDGRVLCHDGTHAFQVGSAHCDCGLERLGDEDVQVAAEAAFDLETAEQRGVTECQDGLHVFPTAGGRCRCGNDYLSIAPPTLALSPPWYLEK